MLNPHQIARACGIQPDSYINTTDLERYDTRIDRSFIPTTFFCHILGFTPSLCRFRPSYNVSPGAYLPVVVQRDGGRGIQCMKWGLVPGFTKKTEKPDHYRMVDC